MEYIMFVNLESYFDGTVPFVQPELRDCDYLYYANPNNGTVTLHKTINSSNGIILDGISAKFNNAGMPLTSNLPQLFKVSQSNYNALVELYGNAKVQPLPQYKSHKQSIIDSLENGKMVLCVTKNTRGQVNTTYTTTLICIYDPITGYYKSFDEKLYDEAIPITTDGRVIYELL